MAAHCACGGHATWAECVERLTSAANDAVQQAATESEARQVLEAAPISVVRAVADLNHIDDHGSRQSVVKRILDDRFGE